MPDDVVNIVNNALHRRQNTLDLSNKWLAALPPEIGQLTALQDLDLRGNRLTALPPEIGQLTALQRLDLEDNQLTALPPEIGQLGRTISLSTKTLRTSIFHCSTWKAFVLPSKQAAADKKIAEGERPPPPKKLPETITRLLDAAAEIRPEHQ